MKHSSTHPIPYEQPPFQFNFDNTDPPAPGVEEIYISRKRRLSTTSFTAWDPPPRRAHLHSRFYGDHTSAPPIHRSLSPVHSAPPIMYRDHPSAPPIMKTLLTSRLWPLPATSSQHPDQININSPYDNPGTVAGYSMADQGDSADEGGKPTPATGPSLGDIGEPMGTNNFVTKLYRMINDPNAQHSISWTKLGTSFVVSNRGEFSRSILGPHFKHNNFSSFVRQLNMYGFHKINRTPRAQRTSTSSQTWEFSHPEFLRDRPDLLHAIKRKAPKPDPREHPTSLSSSNTTVTADPTSQESPVSASDPLRDLTNELRGRPPYPIACGGFGDIWKCILGETVQVAVKTIRAFESDNKALVRKNTKRVRRELKVWGRLKHDCILPLWGVANDFGPYLAMICPWAENGTLTGFLERQQDILSYEDRFSLLNDIALGLQYLHSKSIVHGDLTGSNVLIYGNGRACLADFGLSTVILEFIGTSYFTSSIKGNIRWAAAELFEVPENDEEEDEASAVSLSTECDIYSFGSITLQVLTGKVPYYNVKKDNVVLGQVIRGKKPEPPKESRIKPADWEFIERCWLPRINRPSAGEAVAFVACERGVLSPAPNGTPSGPPASIPASQPQANLADLPPNFVSSDFIQSMSALEDLDPSMFLTNFERDFREWFDPTGVDLI